MNPIIDTHSHLYHKQFQEDMDLVIARAKEAGLTDIYLPNIDLESIEPMLRLEEKDPTFFHAAIGLHPSHVDENYAKVLAEMEAWLNKRDFVAIGETGIDLYWDKTFFEQQKAALRIQCSWAAKWKKPIILHTRDATDETIDLIEDELKKHKFTGVFHCFGGNVAQAKKIMEMGFYLGIGGVVTFKNSNLPDILREVGLRRIVLETDSPYLAPVPFRGKRNESSYTAFVAEKLAEVFNCSIEEICQTTTANAKWLYQA